MDRVEQVVERLRSGPAFTAWGLLYEFQSACKSNLNPEFLKRFIEAVNNLLIRRDFRLLAGVGDPPSETDKLMAHTTIIPNLMIDVGVLRFVENEWLVIIGRRAFLFSENLKCFPPASSAGKKVRAAIADHLVIEYCYVENEPTDPVEMVGCFDYRDGAWYFTPDNKDYSAIPISRDAGQPDRTDAGRMVRAEVAGGVVVDYTLLQ